MHRAQRSTRITVNAVCPPTQVALLTWLQADRKCLCTAGAQEGLGLAENLAETPGKQPLNPHWLRSGKLFSSLLPQTQELRPQLLQGHR